MDMTYDIRCPKCNKLLMKWETLEYDPSKIRGQVVLLADGYFRLDSEISVPDDVLLYGGFVVSEGGEVRKLKGRGGKFLKLFQKLFGKERQYAIWGFNIVCGRCKTRINIKQIPTAWAKVKLEDGVWILPIRFKIVVSEIIEPKTEFRLLNVLEPKKEVM